MTISYVGSTTGTGTSFSMAVPNGVVAGDYMIVALSSRDANTVTPPAGWTLIGSSTGAFQLYRYGRVATGSEPANYSWQATSNINAVCSAFHGTTGPISFVQQSTGTNPGSSFITLPGFTVVDTGALVLMGAYDTTGAVVNSWTAPSGFTLLTDYKGSALPDMGVAFKASQPTGLFADVLWGWVGNSPGNSAVMMLLAEPVVVIPPPSSQYFKSSIISTADFTSFAGVTNAGAGSSTSATAIAGYLWGVGYGDRGYGETTQAITSAMTRGAVVGSEWSKLQSILQSMTTWQNLSSSLYPPTTLIGTGKAIEAHNTAAPTSDAYGIPTLLSTLDSSRLSYNIANMTATASAATTTRAATWGSAPSTITAEFSVTFADENAARFFFNTGGEIRISLSHPSTTTSRNSSWNTTLNGFVASFRANNSARTGGSYGAGTAIGYYGLTTTYQTIVDGTNTGVSPYTVNDFYVEAKASSIAGLNGAKGSVLNFRVRLVDEQTNPFSDVVAPGTVATLGHLRATSGPLTAKAAPTCAVLLAF